MHPVSQRQVAKNTGATAYRAVGPNVGTARHTHATCHRGILANADVMPNLDQVVEFDAVLDHSVGQGAAVNAGIGADLHIVANAHSAELLNLFPGFAIWSKTKPVGADHHPWVKNAAITHHAAFADCDMGLENGTSANTRAALDNAQRADARSRVDMRGGIDHGAGVNTRARLA
jgi:hypothetical protein